MATFQAVAWDGCDIDEIYTVRIFGRTEDGRSVALGTEFEPFFYIKPPKGWKDLSFVHTKCASVERRRSTDLWGFRNGELEDFLLVRFKSHKGLRNFAWCIENNKWPEMRGTTVHEANIDPVLRFMHITGIASTGWLETGTCDVTLDTTCSLNLWQPKWKMLRPVARDHIAPLHVMSFDIECYSSTGAFPDPKNPKDVVFQIGMTTRKFGSDELIDRTCLCLKETEGFPSFKTERELLIAFERHLQKVDPDIITGWNIFGFDLEYLLVRANFCKLDPVWGRVQGIPVELVIKNLSSSALGNNELKMVPMKGRYVFDLFQDVKREHKLESYSLNNVSKRFLSNEEKLDMPVREIFRRYASGENLAEVAEYCIQDTVLPHKLMDKLCQLQNQIEMAKACWVPLSFLSERGQQIKVFSQMAYKARQLNFIIPTFRNKNATADEGYEGATVLDAQAGAYYNPITALDFASLYPSIMCAHNLCYSTLVMDPKYDNLPGIEYEQFGPHRFAQNVQSLLPVILTDLKAFRKKAKKLMAAAEGTPMEAVYNGQQLAYKISMNSMYGFTGASKGMLPLVAIASTVTMRGRQMIEETKNYVEANFPGAKVRYGDSVMPETPVLVRTNNGHEFRPEIQNLADSWISYDHFKTGIAEQCETLDLECMTHLGWKKIKRVVRHKSCKKIYRVHSPYGIVDVTEDHSLLDEDLILIKPYEIKEDDNLLHFGKDIEGSNYVKLLHETWEGYVYDIETEAGTFAAGSGTLIVKNTDSVMVEFDVQGRKGQDAIDYSWEQGLLAAEQCTKLFKAPNDLELEKVYCPYFLYSKKRYAAKMYEGRRSETGALEVVFKKIDIKGLQVVRRDSCPFVRETLKTLLNMILESSDPRPVIDAAREAARTLMSGKVPLEKLLMSKQLASHYKVPMPHSTVRDKMKERSPGSEPQQGDRVSFAIIKGPGKMYEKAEDPGWIREKNTPLDYQYYFTNQLKKPVQDLLEPIICPDTIFDKKFMVKVESGAEINARRDFLARFAKSIA